MDNTINLTDIPVNGTYEGYLWLSDKAKPDVLNNEPLRGLPDGKNPFIVEGQLFDRKNMLSYSIRFVDGCHIVKKYDLEQLMEFEYIQKEYLPNRIPGISTLSFKEFWRHKVDILCEGMKVLKPAEIVFVGFKQ